VKDPASAAVLSVGNILGWSIIFIQTVTVLVAKLSANASGLPSRLVWSDPRTISGPLVISLIALFLVALAAILVDRRIRLRPEVVIATVISLAATSALIAIFAVRQLGDYLLPPGGMFPQGGLFQSGLIISGLIVIAIAYLLLGRLAQSKVAIWVGRALLAIDGFTMAIPGIGYDTLTPVGTIWASLGYLFVLVALAYVSWRPATKTLKQGDAWLILAVLFFSYEVSLARIAFGYGADYWGTGLFVLGSVLALGLLHFLVKAGPAGFYRIMETIAIAIVAQALYQVGWGLHWLTRQTEPQQAYTGTVINLVLCTIGAVGLILILVDRIRRAARQTSAALRAGTAAPSGRIEILTGIGLMVAVLALFMPYDWFIDRTAFWPWGYPTSLVVMVTALVLVALGLWARIKPLRLYGLVVVIACVLKLVTIDIPTVNSITRVVAFLGGAIVCFGISALYNYAAKQFDKELATPPPAHPDPVAHFTNTTPATGLSPADQSTPGQSG
jgi:uncharacterized membrane protein